MQLVLEDRGDRIDMGTLSLGDKGVREVLAAMTARIGVAALDPLVRQMARAYFRDGDTLGDGADALYAFMRDGRRFTEDPAGEELLRDPAEQLARMIRGDVPGMDCDDLAMVAASIIRAAGGLPVLIVVSKTPKSEGGKFHHVFYGVARRDVHPLTRDDVIPFDPQEGTPPRAWPASAQREGMYLVT